MSLVHRPLSKPALQKSCWHGPFRMRPPTYVFPLIELKQLTAFFRSIIHEKWESLHQSIPSMPRNLFKNGFHPSRIVSKEFPVSCLEFFERISFQSRNKRGLGRATTLFGHRAYLIQIGNRTTKSGKKKAGPGGPAFTLRPVRDPQQ